MSLGSSKPWREVIGKLLPENPTLSADGLLEYYAPLLSWLEKKNNKSHNKIGWNPSKKSKYVPFMLNISKISITEVY